MNTQTSAGRKAPGRPKGAVTLSGMSLEFALRVASGATPGQALREVGYSSNIKPHRLLRRPHIAEAIRVFKLLAPEIRRAILGSQVRV